MGGAIGVERERRGREAGLRTHLLVSLGSALFTIVSAYGFHEFLASGASVVRADPSRIAAQIVTGIGFLGAGAIIRQGLSIRGLTTAATLWVVAAIGMAVGAGYYSGAVITTILVLVALWPLRIIGYRVLRHISPAEDRLLVELPTGSSPGPVIAAIESLGARVDAIDVTQDADRRELAIDVTVPPGRRGSDIVTRVAEVEGTLEVRWME
jgi:putative Mg2+ transporter-C (MgtC) family protein